MMFSASMPWSIDERRLRVVVLGLRDACGSAGLEVEFCVCLCGGVAVGVEEAACARGSSLLLDSEGWAGSECGCGAGAGGSSGGGELVSVKSLFRGRRLIVVVVVVVAWLNGKRGMEAVSALSCSGGDLDGVGVSSRLWSRAVSVWFLGCGVWLTDKYAPSKMPATKMSLGRVCSHGEVVGDEVDADIVPVG